MSLALSGADAAHLVAAVGLTYALGFERAVRGAPAGDRVFALIGAGSGVIGIIGAHGAPNAIAGAITGIGFIGGGLVFRRAIGRSRVVVGLNTAAAIFAAAAIGGAAGQGVDRVAERLGVVPGGRAEPADLPHILERGGADIVVGHLLGVRRAEGLDASAHVSDRTTPVRAASPRPR
jgi:hypothetical protein